MSPRRRIAIAAVLLAALGLVGARLRLTDALASLLPADGDLQRALVMLDRFEVTQVLLVEVDGTGATREQLIAATDALGLAMVADGSFREVRWRAGLADGVALQKAASPHAVELLPAEVLAERTSPDGVEAALAAGVARLAGPGGSLFERAFIQDPLDLSGLALRQIRARTDPFRIRLEGGHFLDESGQRAVLFVEPAASSLQAGPDSTLLDTMDRLAAGIALPVRYLGGPRIAVESARSIVADVRQASSAGVALLIALFLLGFRSLRPVAGALGPLAVAAAATFAAAALLSPLHGIALGFSAALLGLSVDYWVHLYVEAASHAPEPLFAARYQAARRALHTVAPALLMGVASTVGAFAVLCLSRFPLVQDLGVMGMAAAAGALLGTWLLGPVAFALVGCAPLRSLRAPASPSWLRAAVLLVVAAAAVLATRGRFDGDPRNLLPVDPDTAALQDELSARYGGFGTGGMAVVENADLGAALDAAAAVQAALAELPGVDAVGPATLLPGPALRAERRQALPAPAELQARIDAAAASLGFAPGALDGVAERTLAPPASPLAPDTWLDTPLAWLVRRHVQESEGTWSVMVSLVLADGAVAEAAGAAARAAAPSAVLVLPSRFAAQGVEEVVDELLRLGGLSLALVLAMLVLRYRSPRRVLASLLPALAALAVTGGGLALAGQPWNALSAGGMVLILGLGLDYGVFMLEATARGDAGPTTRAVAISALTTIAGFGVLVMARAPALSGIGFVLLFGMSSAAVAALVLVPTLARGEPLVGGRLARASAALAFAAVLLLNLDALGAHLVFLRPPAPPEPPRWTLEEPTPGDRRLGPDRMLFREGVHTLFLEGPAWERGYAAGVLAGDLDRRLEDQLMDTFERVVPSPLGRFAVIRGTALLARGLDRTYPDEVRREIAGFAAATPSPWDRLGPAYTRKVYYHAIHDIGQALVDSPLVVAACTGFVAGGAATADGHWLLARNFDFDGGSLFDIDKAVTFVHPDEGIPFASVAFAGFSGVMSGLNAQGLAVALQAGASDPPVRPSTPMTLVAREILQHASSLDEAQAILERRRGFVSENVLVVDGDAGEAALFEVSPARVERLDALPWLAVSNHFRSPAFAEDETNRVRQAEGTTVPRLARMEELVGEAAGRIDMAGAVAILRDRRAVGGGELPRGHRHAIDADIATHSVVIDATARTLWVSRYPNTAGGYVALDLAHGLAGDIEPREVVPRADVRRTIEVHQARELLRQARGASPEAAERQARQALELVPGHPEGLHVLATALVALGRPEEARPLAEQALATPPEYAHEARELRALLEEMP